MRDNNTFLCALLFAVILGLLAADVATTDNRAKTDGPMVALASRQKLPVVLNGDTTFVSLAKGDSVRVIGITRLTYHQDVLVETARGDRGELDASQLPVRQLVIKGKNKGDTLVSLTPKYLGLTVHGYSGRTASGEEAEVDGEDIIPLLEGWEKYNLENNASTSVTTQAAFEKSRGKSLAELEKMYGAAYDILVNSDGGRKAGFRVYAYGSDGRPYRPTVTFTPEGGADGFEFEFIKSKANNGWLLRNLPLAGTIISMPVTKLLTRSSIYGIPTNSGKPVPWYMYVLLVVEIIALLAWYLLPPTLLVLLMGALLGVPIVFRVFGNGALRVLFVAVAAVSAYWWMIALMAWGMHWIFTLLVIPAVAYFTRLSMSDISVRCTKCGHLETVKFDHEEVTGTEFVTKPYSEFKGSVDSGTSYDSFSQGITTLWSDGSKSYRTVQKQVKLKHETSSYDDYMVTFLVTHKIIYFKCANCGHVESYKDDLGEEVSRQKTGSHTERTTEVDKIY